MRFGSNSSASSISELSPVTAANASVTLAVSAKQLSVFCYLHDGSRVHFVRYAAMCVPKLLLDSFGVLS